MNLIDLEIPPIADPNAGRKWSPFQEDIFDCIRLLDDNLLVQAVAGSGKTTTLIEAMGYAQGNSLFMAFNKSIAEDIRRKATSGDVKTLNAMGHSLWLTNRPGAKLDARKNQTILKGLLSPQDFTDYGYTLSRAIGLMKSNAFGIQGAIDIQDVVELINSSQLDIVDERLEDLSAVTLKAFHLSAGDNAIFDFDDQLYAPLARGWVYPRYRNLFVDECQDLNPIQHLMLEAFRKAGSRVIAVGDRHQAIYGFRGALTDSMDLLKDKFMMDELPLSISYRCAQAIVSAAQKYCSTIAARDGAPAGLVQSRADMTLDDDDCWDDPQLFPNQTMVLCRNNAPMFRAILRHIRAKSPCRVMSSFLDSFQGFIRGFKTTYTSDLRNKLDRWYQKELAAAEAKGFGGKVAGLQDKYETVKLLAGEFKFTQDMIEMVRDLGHGTAGPIFSTIHKAKGLEADDVYILRPDLMPSFYAKSPEAKQQEANLIYVAITRAKNTLTWGVKG